MFDLLDHSTQTQRVSCLSVSILLHATLIVLLIVVTLNGRYRFTFLPVVHAGNTEAIIRTVRTPLFLPASGPTEISKVKPVVTPVASERSDTTDTSPSPTTAPAPGPTLLAVLAGIVIPENDAPVSFTYTPRDIPSIAKPEPAIEAMPAPPREEPPAPEPLRIGGKVEQPRQIYRVEPIYPAVAKSARVQGVVEIEGVINEEGRIEQIKVVNGHPLLNDAAVECVRKWKYEPGRLNGQVIEMPIKIFVRFQLRMQ